jgi:hypothetical protein
LARVLSRLAGRLLTGPFAFAVALVVDLLTYAIHTLIHRVNRSQ